MTGFIGQLLVQVDREAGGQMPTRAHDTDAGVDLFTSEEGMWIEPGEIVNVATAVRVALPTGCWGLLHSRSSTLRRHGLEVKTGIIDNPYRGELFAVVENKTDHRVWVEKGTRLAQLILMRMVTSDGTHPLQPVEVEELPGGARGERGFGSTGV